jgi:hypothetical protein
MPPPRGCQPLGSGVETLIPISRQLELVINAEPQHHAKRESCKPLPERHTGNAGFIDFRNQQSPSPSGQACLLFLNPLVCFLPLVLLHLSLLAPVPLSLGKSWSCLRVVFFSSTSQSDWCAHLCMYELPGEKSGDTLGPPNISEDRPAKSSVLPVRLVPFHKKSCNQALS